MTSNLDMIDSDDLIQMPISNEPSPAAVTSILKKKPQTSINKSLVSQNTSIHNASVLSQHPINDEEDSMSELNELNNEIKRITMNAAATTTNTSTTTTTTSSSSSSSMSKQPVTSILTSSQISSETRNASSCSSSSSDSNQNNATSLSNKYTTCLYKSILSNLIGFHFKSSESSKATPSNSHGKFCS